MQPDLRLGTSAATVANRVGSTAVLEYRPAETIPPFGAMLPSPARLCRPRSPQTARTPAETAGFSTSGGETRRDADCLLERTGFEISVPRYLWWSRGSPRYATRAEERVVSESVSPRRRRERIRTPVDRLRSKASSLVCRLESLGIPLKARILRESNGIEDGGTGSQSSPWINVRSRVSAQLVVAPGPWSPATRHHLAPPTNSPDRFRAGRSAAPSGSSRTRSHDTASAARSGS